MERIEIPRLTCPACGSQDYHIRGRKKIAEVWRYTYRRSNV
jgi:Zn finger protein HypA/HybF involved in hydrogenase expression